MMKCPYCGTSANNSTTTRGVYVCCCYRLQSTKDIFMLYHPDKKPEKIRKENGYVVTRTETSRYS